MNLSILGIVSRTIGSASLAGVLLLGGGCADMMTNTPAARADEARLYHDGQYAQTVGASRAQIRRNPADYVSHYYLAASEEKMGSYEQAITEYHATLDLMSHSLEGRDDHEFRMKVLDALADAIVKAKDRDVESAALAKNGNSAESQFLLAKVDRLSGDADAAVEAYDRALLLDPKSFEVAKEYGLYLEKLGQTDRARSALKRAYALNDHDDQVTAALRRVGVVPGPSLKDESDLAKPVIPVGPFPEVDLNKQQQPQRSGEQRAGVPQD